MEYRVLNLGDKAITFEFGSEISRRVSHHVLGVHAQLKEAISLGHAQGILESVPTFRSLTVHYDSLILFPEEVIALVAPYIEKGENVLSPGAQWSFPVCYENEYAPDLEDVAKATGLSVAEVCRLHQSQSYDVFMLGFLPGFAFMGLLDEKLRLPRKKQPRTAVPKGSLAIADQLTAVYPSVSPGGWNLIGRTPIELFNAKEADAVLLKAGDSVTFHAISAQEYQRIEQAVNKGDFAHRDELCLKGAA